MSNAPRSVRAWSRYCVEGRPAQQRGRVLTIEANHAVFEVEGWDKLWSLRSQLRTPLEHIRGARVDPHPALGWFQGLKLAGTGIPAVFRAGMFYQDGGLVFWDVHHPENTIVVELDHEHFQRLVIEVETPEAAAAMINETIGTPRQ